MNRYAYEVTVTFGCGCHASVLVGLPAEPEAGHAVQAVRRALDEPEMADFSRHARDPAHGGERLMVEARVKVLPEPLWLRLMELRPIGA